MGVTRWIKKYYWNTVRIDTNGQGCILNSGRDAVKELKKAGVDKVSVSLNAPDKITYTQVCKPIFEKAYENVLEFIEKAKEVGLEIETTAVTIPEVPLTEIKKLAEKMGVKFSEREYIPCVW